MSPPPAESTLSTSTPRVEYNGCFTTIGDACAPYDPFQKASQLRLWIWPADTVVEVRDDRLEWPADETDSAPIQGGRLYIIELPRGTYELVLGLRLGGLEVDWRLEIIELPNSTLLDDILANKPEILARAGAAVDQDLPAAHLGFAHWVLANLLKTANKEASYTHLERAIEYHGAAGYHLDQLASAANLSWQLLYDGSPERAREVIEAIPQRAREPGLASYRRAYQRGLVAARTGDARNALRLLGNAVRQAERLGFRDKRRQALQVLANQLLLLGRGSEALRIFADLEQDFAGLGPCTQARILDNQAWHMLLEFESRRLAEDPLPKLLEARHLLANCRASKRNRAEQEREIEQQTVNQATNLALAYLHANQLDKAADELQEARRIRQRAQLWQVFWWQDIEARIALAQQQPQRALTLYEQLEASASSGYMPDVHIRAALGKARARKALGDAEEALRILGDNEILLEEAALQVPIDIDRARFFARRETSTRLYLQLLIDAGKKEQALSVARLARSRVLRSLLRDVHLARLTAPDRRRWQVKIDQYTALRSQLDHEQADDWQLAKDQLSQVRAKRLGHRQSLKHLLDEAYAMLSEARSSAAEWGRLESLPKLETGEVRLLYHPLPEGWVAFVESAAGIHFEILDQIDTAADPEILAAVLLQPFAREIAAASALRVLPYGAIRAVDFHALPFGDAPLLATRTVVYGLDLPPAPRSTAADKPVALVVADPTGDLPHSRQEARAMHFALSKKQPSQLLEGSSADGDAVRQGLAHSDFFYYAGHGVWASWESALPLHHGSRLDVGDVLALPRVPRQVILSACEAARSPIGAAESVAGIAQALLTAGSQQVVAATRPVNDQVAAKLMAILQRQWLASGDLAEALRRAQLQTRQENPQADWASFRLLER